MPVELTTQQVKALVAPENDFTPYYRHAGVFLMGMFGLTVGTFLAAILLQTPMTGLVIKVLAGLAGLEMFAALMIIIRDKRFERIFKIIVAAIPWTKYQGDLPKENA